jgi:hypothetical protein
VPRVSRRPPVGRPLTGDSLMSSRISPAVLTLTAALGLAAGPAAAQLDVEWVKFTPQPSLLGPGIGAISASDIEVDFATGDLDNDGDQDLVVARKQPFCFTGKRTDVLLMNVGGVLTDMTAALATASDAPGDMGFLTPCNHTDVQIADLDNDGWRDVIMVATLSDGSPKDISHPRIYRNRGQDGSGNWLGLIYETARIPQLLATGGIPAAPRFSEVAVGDLEGDGYADLYFVDHDGTSTGIAELEVEDLNDRYLRNDGNGYFVDQSLAHFTATQLQSNFGSAVRAVDVNDDGALDIVKCSTQLPPIVVRALYNNPSNAGNFTTTGTSDFGSQLAYGFGMGDLNNDGLIDAAFADDGQDRYRFGTGFDVNNKMLWSLLKNFTYATGGDEGFAQHVYARDLDLNGWADVLITDTDIELPGCSHRMHIFHNKGSTPGDMNVVLREESELATGNLGAGWKGVVGLTAVDLKGTYDVALADFDGDGDLDMVIAKCSGTALTATSIAADPTLYWRNETITERTCQADLGFAGPGNVDLSICGDDLTQAGSAATLEISGALANQPLFLALGLTNAPMPLKGGTLVPNAPLVVISGLTTSGSGTFTAPVAGAGGAPLHIYLQAIVKSDSVFQFSNALDVLIGT